MSMFTGQRHTQQRFFACGISDCETTSGGSTHSLFECFYLSVLVNVKSHQSHRPPSPNATNEMSPITACFNFNLIKTQRIKETHTTAHTHKTHNTLFCLYIYIWNPRNTMSHIVNAPTRQTIPDHNWQPHRNRVAGHHSICLHAQFNMITVQGTIIVLKLKCNLSSTGQGDAV